VYPGDPVRRGQILGGAGSTGFSTGPHLHWEVRVFGVPVDPLPYLET
jgi:murein DD-endopeptidase MepM/ murein hydrolase activator NlpD